jgi:hypothetical protein
LTDKSEPNGVEAVKWTKTAFGIPPSFGILSEAPDLFRVDRCARPAHDFDPFR